MFILFSNILEKFAFFFLYVLIARNYSNEIFGLITATFAFGNIIISFFEFGLSFYFQREAATDSPELKKRFSQAISFRVLTSILYLVVICVYFFYTSSSEYFLATVLLGLAVFIFSMNNLGNSILYGKNDYKSAFIALIISRFSLVAVVFTTLYSSKNFELFCFSFVLGGLIHMVLLSGGLRKHGIVPKLEFPNRAILMPILESSGPIALGIIFVWLYDRGDVLILRHYLGNQAIAIYAVAYSLYKLPQAFAGFLFTPLFSEVSKEFAECGFLSRKLVIAKARHIGLLVLPVLVLLYFFHNTIVVLAYGSQYSVSSPYFLLLLTALPALFGNNYTGIMLNAVRMESFAAKSVLYAAILNLGLNIIVIPFYGIMGAVLVTILTEYCTLLIQILYIYRANIIQKDITK